MKATRALLMTFAALMLAPTAVRGAVQRTFVASNGLDANPCSIAQPCRTFGAAIAKTVAGGEVVALDSAGYGIVTIVQSVSLIAPQGVYAGISVAAGQTGVTVNAPAAIVVLRGLSINGVAPGSVNGIHFAQGARLRVEGCVVSNLASTGIVQDAAGSEMVVFDTIVRDNAEAGIILGADATAVLDGVHVEHNAGDGFQVYAVSAAAYATVRNSVLTLNGQGGLAAIRPFVPARTEVLVEHSDLSRNSGDGAFIGGISDGAVWVTFTRNTFEHNGLSGISIFGFASGGSLANAVNARITDNTFLKNGTAAIKTDGTDSGAYSSRNTFQGPQATFRSDNGSTQITYGDNVCFPLSLGTAPVTLGHF